MTDGKKSKEQLLAEIEALKAQLEQHDRPEAPAGSTPVLSTPLTRRALSTWVAPVIMSLPVLATVLKPGEAHAEYYGGTDDIPVIALPTMTPTKSPTVARVPTRAPTASPTRAGRCVPSPTAAPTLGMGAAPDSGPIPVGFIALGSARALAAARV